MARKGTRAHVAHVVDLVPDGYRGFQDWRLDGWILSRADLNSASSFEAGLPDTAIGSRDRALLLLGFAGAFRRAELVGIKVEDLTFADDGLVVLLRRSKTDQEGQGPKVAVPSLPASDACPVRAVRAWMEKSTIVAGPLFRSVVVGGRVQDERLSDGAVALIVRRRLPAGKDTTKFAGLASAPASSRVPRAPRRAWPQSRPSCATCATPHSLAGMPSARRVCSPALTRSLDNPGTQNPPSHRWSQKDGPKKQVSKSAYSHLDLVCKLAYYRDTTASELKRKLAKLGCTFEQGARHVVVIYNGKATEMPRHPAKEIKTATYRQILKDLGIKER